MQTLSKLGFIFVFSALIGFYVGFKIINANSTDFYQFLGVSRDEKTQLGFTCKCENISGKKTWVGIGGGCNGASSDAISLRNHIQDPNTIDADEPEGACCRPQPRVGDIYIRDLIPGIMPVCG